jgi:ATP-dependent DNA ligase
LPPVSSEKRPIGCDYGCDAESASPISWERTLGWDPSLTATSIWRQLFTELQPLVTTFNAHPWNWAAHEAGERTPRRNEGSRWNAGKDLSFVPLRPERVVEVRYDHMEGQRFRHTAQFNRWRPDRDPRSCTYAQLEQPITFSLSDIVPGLGPRQCL